MELIELYLNISNVYKLSLVKRKKGQLFYFQKISVTFTQQDLVTSSAQMVGKRMAGLRGRGPRPQEREGAAHGGVLQPLGTEIRKQHRTLTLPQGSLFL